MQEPGIERQTIIGVMHKRRETMTDGRRYIIYYDFKKAEEQPKSLRNDEKSEEKKDV